MSRKSRKGPAPEISQVSEKTEDQRTGTDSKSTILLIAEPPIIVLHTERDRSILLHGCTLK